MGEKRDGICILSFDGGGPGTYSQLLILKECVSRLANDFGNTEDQVYPAEYFDLMGGVGFGGLVAFMLGYLRMNVNEAIETLLEVVPAVFPEDSQRTFTPEINSANLKGVIEDMLRARQIPISTKMNESNRPQTGCKVALYAATSTDISQPHVFRTYTIRGSSLNPTIADALCATISVPSHFMPVKVGSRLIQRNFIGGPRGVHNPTRELLREASIVFGNERRVAQIISIGYGTGKALSLEVMTQEDGPGRVLREMAADCRMVAQDLGMRLFNVDAYRRFDVEKGMGDIGMDDWTVLGNIEVHTKSYIETPSVSKNLDLSLQCLRNRVGTATLGQLNQSSSIKIAAKAAPAVSAHFVLRAKHWQIMVWFLVTEETSRQRIFTITGMGGCGKTQMVSYFLQEYGSIYTHVAFVDASSITNIKTDFQTWARALGIGHEQDVWEDGFRTLASVPENERWALILDNADDPTISLGPFMPQNTNLTVVITSRNRDVGYLSTTHHLEVGEMEEAEALAVLLKAARRELKLSNEELASAQTLMKELGYLALALVQAGTYCHQLSSVKSGILQPFTFTQYLSLFYSHRTGLMKKTQPFPLDSYERGVYTTLDLSYQVIPQDTRDFLHFISFFHCTNVPLEALAVAAKNQFTDECTYLQRPGHHQDVVFALNRLLCVEGSWGELQVQDMVQTLRSFSLLSVTSFNQSVFLHLHPLVQAWSRDMVRHTPEQYQAMATQVLTSNFGDDSFRLYRYLFPHIIDMLAQISIQSLHVNDLVAVGSILRDQGHYRTATELLEATLEIMNGCVEQRPETVVAQVTEKLAVMYWLDGRWGEAEELQVKVLEQRQKILGKEHPSTITAALNLASTYGYQGRWTEAEKLQVEALEQSQKILGKEHPDAITGASNLALTYSSQGRWIEAEKLQVEVLEQSQKILGKEHPNTITAASNLALTCSSQGRWTEAEKLQVEVLEQRQKNQGKEHPDTTTAASGLASTYGYQGRWTEAEKLQVEVLEQRQKILGKEHPDTITGASNLAATYSSQGRWIEAEKLQVEVLEQCQKILGKEHPDTITAASDLALTYSSQGRWTEAEKLQVEVLEQSQNNQGKGHPSTITAASNLALTYSSQGRWTEAEKLEMEVLEQRQKVLGKEHPNTITAASNLALTYSSQGRWTEAEKLQVEVLEQRQKILGKEHPGTITAASNLASTYSSQGRWTEAKRLQVEVLEQRQKVLRKEHPGTITAASNLASTYSSQGRWTEAEKLQVEVLEQSKKNQGKEHPSTITAASNLALTYNSQGRWTEAEKLQMEVLEQRQKVLGKEHPDTITAASNLALTYSSQGRWAEAEKLRMEVLEQRQKVLGKEHPGTITAASNLALTCGSQGRWTEAEKLQVEVLEQRQKNQGKEHPDTIMAASNLALTYSSQGRWTEAEKLEMEVLQQRQKVLGKERPDTITAAANLSVTYRAQGRYEEEVGLLAPAVQLALKVLGQQHPDTQLYISNLVYAYEELGKLKEAEGTKTLLMPP